MNSKLKTSLLAGISTLLLLAPSWKDSTLTDIAKPHLGTYECIEAHLGKYDCLERFSDIRLELKEEERYTLLYKEKGGARKKIEGKYRYDEKAQTVYIIEDKTGTERAFPLVKGKLTVAFPVGGKTMVLRFERK